MTTYNDEYLQKIKALEIKDKENEKRIAALNKNEYLINDYQSMQDRLESAEKKSCYLEKKVRDLSMNLKELTQSRERIAHLTSQIDLLSSELELIEKKRILC